MSEAKKIKSLECGPAGVVPKIRLLTAWVMESLSSPGMRVPGYSSSLSGSTMYFSPDAVTLAVAVPPTVAVDGAVAPAPTPAAPAGASVCMR